MIEKLQLSQMRLTYGFVNIIFGVSEGLLDFFNVWKPHRQNDGQALVLIHFKAFKTKNCFAIYNRSQKPAL